MTDPIRAVMTLDIQDAVASLLDFVGEARDAVNELVALAEVQASAERGFLRLASQRGAQSDQLLAKQQEFNSALQQFTGIGDEVLLGLQRQALAMRVHEDELSKVTLAALGMAEAHDLSLNEAIRKASRVINGEVEQLVELGVEFKTSAEAIDFYAEASTIATDRAERLSGASASLDATLGDLGETLGKIVNESDPLIENTTALDKALRDLNVGLQQNEDTIQRYFDKAIELTREWGAEAAGLIAILNPLAAGQAGLAAGLFGLRELADAGAASPDFVGPPQETDRERARRVLQEEREREIAARKSKQRREREKRERERAARERERAEERERRDRQRSLAIATREEERAREAELDAIRRHNDQIAREEKRLADERLQRQANLDRERREAFEMAEASFANAVHQGFSASIGAVVEAAVQGETDLASAVGGIVGGIISTQGDMLIQLGTAGILAGTLGTVIPAFAAITGGPLGVAAGSAAVAGGIAMKAVGAALGGSSGESSGAPATGSAGSFRGGADGREARQNESAFLDRVRASRRSDVEGTAGLDRGFGRGFGETNTTNIFQVSFRGAAVARSETQLTRDLAALDRRHRRLNGERVLPGAA